MNFRMDGTHWAHKIIFVCFFRKINFGCLLFCILIFGKKLNAHSVEKVFKNKYSYWFCLMCLLSRYLEFKCTNLFAPTVLFRPYTMYYIKKSKLGLPFRSTIYTYIFCCQFKTLFIHNIFLQVYNIETGKARIKLVGGQKISLITRNISQNHL